MFLDTKILLKQFWSKKLSKESLYKTICAGTEDLQKFVREGLMAVSHEESDERLEDYLTLIFLFNIPVDTCVPYLNKLLTCKWHHQHENIVTLLEMAADAHSTNFLYRAAGAKLEYLSFDRSFSLAVKCIWALGRIARKGDTTARKKLERLTKSTNSVIKQNAENQLRINRLC